MDLIDQMIRNPFFYLIMGTILMYIVDEARS